MYRVSAYNAVEKLVKILCLFLLSPGEEPEAIEITPKEDGCLSDIGKCGASGITLNFRVKLKAIVENSIIFSSGGEQESGYGMALFYALGRFQFVVRIRTTVWRCYFDTLPVKRWVQLTLSWQENYGVIVYVNRRSVARSIVSIPRMKPLGGDLPRTKIFIGRAYFEKSVFKYTSMVIERFQFFFGTPQALVRHQLIQLGKWHTFMFAFMFDIVSFHKLSYLFICPYVLFVHAFVCLSSMLS